MNTAVPIWDFFCFLFTVEKVIILVCNGQSTTNTYNEFIGKINKLEKTFVAQVNNGKLAMDPDIFCSQVLNLPITCSTPNTQFISQEQVVNADSLSTNSYNLSENYPQGNSSERKSIDDMSAQNSQQLVLATQFLERPPPVVVLRSFIRHGQISYREEDLQIWDPEFQFPDEIQSKLLKECSHIPLLGVRIMKLSSWSCDTSYSSNSQNSGITHDNALCGGSANNEMKHLGKYLKV